MKLYPYKCDVSGVGIESGFVVYDKKAKGEKEAEKLSKEIGYKDLKEAIDHGVAYFEKWDLNEIAIPIKTAYTLEGEKIDYNFDNCHICGDVCDGDSTCLKCDLFYCENHSAEYSIHNQVDYNCCENCQPNRR